MSCRRWRTLRPWRSQPILSIADVQWVLHHAKDSGSIRFELDRSGKRLEGSIAFTSGWRKGDFTWREWTWGLRHRLAGTEELEPLPEKGMALRVKALPPDWVWGRNTATGLQPGDVLVELDGRRDLLTEADFLAYLMQEKRPGQVVAVHVRRGGKVVRTHIKIP